MLDQTTNEPADSPQDINKVTVYAASSDALHPDYFAAARRTGEVLAEAGMTVYFGGGGTGLMGAMADGALAGGADIHGIVPVFLKELEVSHPRLTSLTLEAVEKFHGHQ